MNSWCTLNYQTFGMKLVLKRFGIFQDFGLWIPMLNPQPAVRNGSFSFTHYLRAPHYSLNIVRVGSYSGSWWEDSRHAEGGTSTTVKVQPKRCQAGGYS